MSINRGATNSLHILFTDNTSPQYQHALANVMTLIHERFSPLYKNVEIWANLARILSMDPLGGLSRFCCLMPFVYIVNNLINHHSEAFP